MFHHLFMERGVATLIAASTVFMASVGQGVASESNQANKLIEHKREWITETDEQDYFFWKRLLYRYDNPGEFPNPPEWYNPGTLIIGAPSAPVPSRPLADRKLSQSTINDLEAYLRQQESGAMYVSHKGEIEYEFFEAGWSSGNLLPIRSVSKSLLSLLAGAAFSDGFLKDLDEPIRNYIPEWANDERGLITVHQVLFMATGLEYVPLRAEPTNKTALLAEGSDVNEAALSWEKTDPVNTIFSINQVDSQILTIILERATGKGIDQYLSEKLWRPLGLGTATMNVDFNGNVRGFCCLRMRAIDMIKIGQMLLNGGVWEGRQILAKSWIDEMLKPSPANPQAGLHAFLGWDPGTPDPAEQYRPYSEPYRTPGVFFFQGGLSIVLWMIPAEDLVIFRWGYDVFDTWDMNTIPNLILDDLMAPE